MTGPEHYAAAQAWLASAGQAAETDAVLVAIAQVHATLALVAATVEAADPDRGMLDPELVKVGADYRSHQYEPSAWAKAVRP